MSEIGLSHLFSTSALSMYKLHFFKDYPSFEAAALKMPFFSVIFSLSGLRAERIDCLKSLLKLAKGYPSAQRIVLAQDDTEVRLMSLLSPSSLHGIISKTLAIGLLQEQLSILLNNTHRLNQNVINDWYVSKNNGLSPTERAILHYMTYGYSMPEIAHYLSRNIKTVRAHKFNAMTKLGVHSDAGLLDAADILMHISVDRKPPAVHMVA
ncbi:MULTISPECIES: DNA-binding transcriptional activator BglJ [unclassified Enterobacter]|uniref:DNA-binding transcriptional activator BglJ n=1 Tax=unclassified Enterobacter TaxID=2608935 RepID=UPI00296E6E39|nr:MULTISPECIES: DNA-binding transcriptional activator BglJ [unclassified Enterobacter]WJD50832.1 DNA-binding transcriptional activator BglJ [Enterobacter sp. PGRG2]